MSPYSGATAEDSPACLCGKRSHSNCTPPPEDVIIAPDRAGIALDSIVILMGLPPGGA